MPAVQTGPSQSTLLYLDYIHPSDWFLASQNFLFSFAYNWFILRSSSGKWRCLVYYLQFKESKTIRFAEVKDQDDITCQELSRALELPSTWAISHSKHLALQNKMQIRWAFKIVHLTSFSTFLIDHLWLKLQCDAMRNQQFLLNSF